MPPHGMLGTQRSNSAILEEWIAINETNASLLLSTLKKCMCLIYTNLLINAPFG